MSVHKPITAGERFARLTVLTTKKSVAYTSGKTKTLLGCRCDCGTELFVAQHKLRSGHTKSCGCLSSDNVKKRNFRHGLSVRNSVHRVYRIWVNMLSRCGNSNVPCHKQYGARGISVCERWFKFENFLEDMGEPPDNLTLERLDNNKGYCKENCEWKTMREQGRNRRTSFRLSFNGVTLTLVEWSERLGIRAGTIKARYNAGWPIEDILSSGKYFRKSGNFGYRLEIYAE